jgi:hypothetical protein
VIENEAIYMRNAYASLGGTTYLQMDYWKGSISALDQGLTLYSDEARGSVIDGGNLSLNFKQADVVQLTNTSSAGWYFKNTINTNQMLVT